MHDVTVEVRDIIDRVCHAVDPNPVMADLEEFAKREKLAGTPSELESFRYLEQRMQSLGYATELIIHDAYISLPGQASLEVGGMRPICITHSFSQSNTGLSAEIIDLGRWSPDVFTNMDVRGKILLLEGLAIPIVGVLATRAGAVGLIHISPHEYRHEMCLSPVWGNPDLETLAQLPGTVSVTVSADDGRAIREMLSKVGELTATITAEVDTGWRKTPLLTAELLPPGADTDCPFILFSGHHDTWYEGVMDNGSANAAMIAVATTLKKERAHWRRGLRFCFWSGHSQGRYSSSAWYADTHFQELEARCIVHVNVDSVGGNGATVLSDTPASTELRGVAREAVLTQGGQEILGLRMMRAGDQSFWGIGVPSIFMGMGEQPRDPGGNNVSYASGLADRNGAGFGWWWHTEFDTIDKLDLDLVVRDTRVYCHGVARLLCSEALPFDYILWLDEFSATIAALAETVGDALNFAIIEDRIAALRRLVQRDLDDRALMRVGRALVPLDFTAGDRFRHDAALSAAPYPVLDPIRRLAKAPRGEDVAHFAAVTARQSVNRVVAMLDAAILAIK